MRHHVWMCAVVLAFVAVFSASLTFEYVEGDDASTIAFHVLGRRADLQPPYSVFHSMMDALLGLLPAREGLLRVTAVSLSAVAAVVMTLLILALAFDRSRSFAEVVRLPSALAFLLAVPEVFYLGLVLTPSLIAMSLVLASHLVARRAARSLSGSAGGRREALPGLAAAAALFGAGAAFRWDVVTYGAVIAADLALSPEEETVSGSLPRRLAAAVGWGASALLAFLCAVVVSGYRHEDVLGAARFGVGFSLSRPLFSASAAASIQSLLTPGFALLAAAGLWVLARRAPRQAIVVVLGVLLILPWLASGVPKYLLVALPGLATAFVLGFSRAWSAPARRVRTPARAAVALCLALPWLVGLRIAVEHSSWGPGFEVRPFTSDLTRALRPTFGPGAAAPTPEGPRPVFGHLHVLLGGGWRHLLHELAAERSRVVERAAAGRLAIVRHRGSNGFDTAELVARGFVTRDPAGRRSPRMAAVLERRFQGPRGLRVTYLRLAEPDDLEGFSRVFGGRVILLSYPSDLRRLHRCAPGALEPIGPMSGLLDLKELKRSPC